MTSFCFQAVSKTNYTYTSDRPREAKYTAPEGVGDAKRESTVGMEDLLLDAGWCAVMSVKVEIETARGL